MTDNALCALAGFRTDDGVSLGLLRLESLDVRGSGTDLTDAGLCAIADGTFASTLRRLDLSRCSGVRFERADLPETFWRRLMRGQSGGEGSLTELSLAECGVSTEGCVGVAGSCAEDGERDRGDGDQTTDAGKLVLSAIFGTYSADWCVDGDAIDRDTRGQEAIGQGLLPTFWRP